MYASVLRHPLKGHSLQDLASITSGLARSCLFHFILTFSVLRRQCGGEALAAPTAYMMMGGILTGYSMTALSYKGAAFGQLALRQHQDATDH